MAREDNPFLTYMNSHPGSDAVALKQLFRMLAKRTHPDLGAENEADFVRLQDAYSEAVGDLIRREENARTHESGLSTEARSGSSAGPEIWRPSTQREYLFHSLNRYMAHLPSLNLEPGAVPPACRRAFADAMEASLSYTEESRYALEQFHRQFHTKRRVVARFPEATTKYRALVLGLASFFDFCVMPNLFNRRLVLSYLSEIKPVTNFDPGAPAEVRYNRSAGARSAMYRMRIWLEAETGAGPCQIL